ncbi:MAG TPA: protein kinase [Anaerolineales bacterium]|nr:protein kinase [Anaerolineales bacterium]
MADSMIGKTINRYQIVELLGRGGMAEVYKAFQPSLDRYVAMKVMHSFLSEDKDFFERFNREAKNVATLKHPNIIQIHDFDHEGDTYYMVMEFVDGGTLKDRLEKLHFENKHVPVNEAVRIIKDVGAALSYSHKRGMIHRDIKPANVMIDSTGRVILTDFGIAKILSGAKFTASGSILGTPSYMSPEQGLGQPGDARSDIYSLGVMLYQLVTGKLPYEADTPVAVILKHVNEKLPLPRLLNPEMPQGLENVIIKALAKDPAERYQSVDEMLAHLSDLSAADHIALPAESTIASRPGAPITADPGATVYSGGHTQQIGAPARKSQTPTEPPLAEQKPRSNLIPAIIGVVAVLAVIGVVGVLAVGGIIALGRPTSTAVAQQSSDTPRPPTATTDQQPAGSTTADPVLLALTQQAGTAAAQQATIDALQATDTPTPTPDFTGTAAACTLSAALEGQDPKDNTIILINRDTKVVLKIHNTSNCDWDEQATFAFVSGDTIHTSDSAAVNIGGITADHTTEVTLTLRPTKANTYKSVWQITLGGGRVVGDPITLTYRAAVPATAAPTVPPATPTLAATPTIAGGGEIQSNPTFHRCFYVPGTSDYECAITISIRGGVPPYFIIVDNDTFWSGPASPDKDFQYQRKSRRCDPMIFSWEITDSVGTYARGSGFFDPDVEKKFNGNTEVCGLG